MKTIICTTHYNAPDVIQLKLNIVDELKFALVGQEMNSNIIVKYLYICMCVCIYIYISRYVIIKQ